MVAVISQGRAGYYNTKTYTLAPVLRAAPSAATSTPLNDKYGVPLRPDLSVFNRPK